MNLALLILATSIDSTTNVPLGYLFGFAATVFLAGCWVSAKANKIEEFKEQQEYNMKRLDALDAHLDKVKERLWVLENTLPRH